MSDFDIVREALPVVMRRGMEKTTEPDPWHQALGRIQAEHERLREALEAIAATDDLVEENDAAFAVYAYRRCQQTARAALGEQP